jgi:hypothetical protein
MKEAWSMINAPKKMFIAPWSQCFRTDHKAASLQISVLGPWNLHNLNVLAFVLVSLFGRVHMCRVGH